MRSAAHRTRPYTITQGNGMIEVSAHMTAFPKPDHRVLALDSYGAPANTNTDGKDMATPAHLLKIQTGVRRIALPEAIMLAHQVLDTPWQIEICWVRGMPYRTTGPRFLTSRTHDHGGQHWQSTTHDVATSGKANVCIKHACILSQSRAERCPITRTAAGVAIPKYARNAEG